MFAGCNSAGISARIQEKSQAFEQLTPATQKHIREGLVERGYTKDMVYIALGRPNRVENRTSADGPIEVWIYKNISLPANGFHGVNYSTDVGSIIPGYDPSKSIQSQQASGARSSSDQQFNHIDFDAVARATQLPDLPMGTLYVFFYSDRVFRLNLSPN